ncbi:MAG: response regulator [Candidatus Bipolaricaulia bacterium]
MKKILVIEDEERIVELVQAYLERAGYRVLAAYDGQAGLELFQRERPALVILDLMLPEVDGLDVARQIRRESDVPLIMLTARTEEADRVAGLELGADDYITKPFSLRELVARVRAVLRRAEGGLAPLHRLERGDLVIDLEARQVELAGRAIELTPTEFDLLVALAHHPGRVFDRLQLLEALNHYPAAGFARTIDTHIKNLRKKLEPDPGNPKYIQTVHGVGYRFRKEV